MRLDIVGRGAHDHALAGDASRDHTGSVFQVAGPDCKIVAIVREIRDRIAEREVQLQLWMLLRELQQNGSDAVSAKERRHGDAQLSTRLGELIGREGIRCLRLREHRTAAFVIGAAEVRQALPARGPVDEAHAEALLQKADMFADHRRG